MALPKDITLYDYHGTKVADPFRYMEDPTDPQTKAWSQIQTRVTREYLDSIPARAKIKKSLTQLWNYPKTKLPKRVAGKYFFQRNTGLESQAAVYMQEDLDSEPRVILDPNTFSSDGTIALTTLSFSKDGRFLAYARSESGSDWQEIHVLDIAAASSLPDAIRWCKFTSIPWLPDGSGFFYTRFPEPGSVPPEDAVNFSKVYLHRLGTDQSEDELIFHRPDYKEMGFTPQVTEDGEYLVLEVWVGTEPENRIYYRKLAEDGPFVRLLDESDAMYRLIGNVGSIFYFHTTKEAPNGRIIAIDLEKPEPKNWQEIIAQSCAVIEQVTMVGQKLAVVYVQDAFSSIHLFELDGTSAETIALPGLGTVSGISGKPMDEELFFTFTSYLHPTSVYHYDLSREKLRVFAEPRLDFNADDYETKQVFYESKDGTKVPMFITCRKDIKLDGKNPTLLYGYGGFGISMTPVFDVSNLIWLEAGGIYAVACLRGGNEYGESWHRKGMLENKQNVFDDFISAAEWLIASNYTNTQKLAIMGRSNGGLLTAACMVQRPDLYGAVVSVVPVIDMLRYHRFTAGRYWIGEYGNAEASAEHFRFLYAYSPLHNIRFGTVYPPVLILTAESDDRVVPMHSKKFAATLQAAAGGSNPIYLYVEDKAGHGAGKPTTKLIDAAADMFAFLWDQLGCQ
ncbi:MAG: S9 family peptidase [Firmicutes bacterium]|nr:S9 family peptidase [Bacillota bacterium]